MRLRQALSARDWHVWCPAPVPPSAPSPDGGWLVLGAWPKLLGFGGWRSGGRIFAVPVTLSGDPTGAAAYDITPEGAGYVSAINPKVVVAHGALHLFYSGVRPGGRYDIAHAPLAADENGRLRTGPVQTGLLPFETEADGQGPTNPAPVCRADGTWAMVYRTASAAGAARQLHMATAPAATGPWSAVEGAFAPGGDLEDPFLWEEDGALRLLVRDLGGTLSGQTWPTLARARFVEGAWVPDATPHVLNRALPDAEGTATLWHRVERPARGPDGSLWLACSLADPDHSELRRYDWPGAAPFLERAAGPARPTTARLPLPPLPPAPEADPIDVVTGRNLSYLPRARLESIRAEVARLTKANARGLIVECGVALGGSGIVMAAEMGPGLAYRGYDVFGQIPPPSDTDGAGSRDRFAVISEGRSEGIGGESYYGYVPGLLDRVKAEFAACGAAVDGERIALVQGLFEDSLHFAQGDVIRLAHIDCDWYEGTKLCLQRIAPFVPKWGVILIDDFADWPGCRRAVHEFLAVNDDFLLREVQPHAVIRRFEVTDG